MPTSEADKIAKAVERLNDTLRGMARDIKETTKKVDAVTQALIQEQRNNKSSWEIANAIHRSLGHDQFIEEAKRNGWNDVAVQNVCQQRGCEHAPKFKAVKNIPVTVNFDHTRPPIGVADIHEDGTILITVKEKHMTADLIDLFATNEILAFSLGFEYMAATKGEENAKEG